MSRRLLMVLVALVPALSSAGSARAEVKDAAPDGFTVENTIRVPVEPMRAWNALVNDVDRWWPKDHSWWGQDSVLSIEPRAGGCFCERKGAQQAQHLLVVFVDPGKLLRLTGGLGPLQGMGLSGVLEFRLAPDDDGGTVITMYYRAGGYAPDDLSKLAPVVDGVQAQQIGGLATLLGGRLISFLGRSGALAECPRCGDRTRVTCVIERPSGRDCSTCERARCRSARGRSRRS